MSQTCSYNKNIKNDEVKMNTISGSTNLIEGFGRSNITLHSGTMFINDNVLLFTKSMRDLLSFKDIQLNGYHIETINNNVIKHIYIISNDFTRKKYLKN